MNSRSRWPSSRTRDDNEIAVLQDHDDDPVREELWLADRGALSRRADRPRGLHWIGRDDGQAGDWQEVRRQADAHNEHTAGYLCGNPSSAITWRPDLMLSACLAPTDRP
ncbi:DUF3775 domain-containing protein [Mesorhizobium sp.]|uniref:DUF3775 domain-containing protein n=1 Tax=Mesorhizobium sp. TaxID=1871066 RepID=UPI0025E0C621|nr:DUF3775 domain-containing protein [Mesorhizobium sp.]